MKLLHMLLITFSIYANSLSFTDKIYLIKSAKDEHQILFQKHAAIYKVKDMKVLAELKKALKKDLQVLITTNNETLLITKVKVLE